MASRASPLSVLDLQVSANAGQVITLSNELDSTVFVSMEVFGLDGTTATLKRNGNDVATATFNVTAGDNTIGKTLVSLAQVNFVPADVVTIAISVAACTRVVIYTRFPDVYAWPLTTSVA